MKRFLKILAGIIALCAVAIVIARLVFTLPPLDARPASTALPATEETRLGAAIMPLAKQHPGKTGIVPLATGTDAFAARALLAQSAETSIDAQYYIWHGDLTGMLLLKTLKDAAERGVRVRLLVDDNGTSGLDPELAALNALPAMEVRLFNPFQIRSPKFAGYLFDFFRLNRRMHNKSFTVDNAATVIGGRNVGDEYFGTGPQSLYFDLDVLAVGEVVPKVSADFDRYWASASAYPAELLVTASSDGLEGFEKSVSGFSVNPQFANYQKILRDSRIADQLLNKTLSFEWADVKLVSDDPVKTLGKASRDQLMISRLVSLLGSPETSLDLVSPYFVPGDEGTSQFAKLEKDGVAVRILTNAMEATDVAPVHAGYAKRREDLLQAGVQLFELKAQSSPTAGRAELDIVGSSGSSLHAKTFAVDRKRIYVGSFNFDPRSALLNTEMGLLIESPALASGLSDLFDNRLPIAAYRPERNNGDLVWVETTEAGEMRHYYKEPNTSAFQRALVTFIGWLPVEWML